MAEDYAKKLNILHNKLVKQFTSNKKDIETAKALEGFLNYVVYDKDDAYKFQHKNQDIATVLTRELANQLRQDPIIKNKFLATVNKGQSGEEAFAYALSKIIENSAKEGKIQNMEENLKNVIIGNAQASIISSSVAKVAENQIKQELAKKTGNIRQYTQYALRSGKIDIDMHGINIGVELTGFGKTLSNITASVKNYTDFSIHLENLNRFKAVQATLAELYPKLDQEGLFNYAKYLINQSSSNNQLAEHILHISYIYALTGYGQTYFFKAAEAFDTKIEKKYAKFLMYNNNEDRIIKIQSTREIVRQLLNQKSAYGRTFSSRQKLKGSSYEIRLILDK